MYSSGPTWTSTDIRPDQDGRYFARADAPESGATAFMVELTYDVGGNELVFTTDVSIVSTAAQTIAGDYDLRFK